jgi:RNA polymerase sigma-70 factor (ECF subfamily)
MEPLRASEDDVRLVARLRARDEAAYMMLVETLTPAMRRVARMYVRTDAVADEVVQDAWVGVLEGIDRFEGRSSLRTWIFRILVNIARNRGKREGRSVAFAVLAGGDLDHPSWDPSAFLGPEDASAGHWSTLPFDWRGVPEDRVEAGELRRLIRETLDTLPAMQAEVLRLRDVAGWSSEEIRNALDLTDTNERVLLHRARTRVREAIDGYFRTVGET